MGATLGAAFAAVFVTCMQMAEPQGGLRAVVVTDHGKLIGALRMDPNIPRPISAASDDVTLGELVGGS